MIRTGTGQCIDSMSAVPVSHLAQLNHARVCEAVCIIHIVHVEITRTTGTVGQGLQDQEVRVASVPGLDWDRRGLGFRASDGFSNDGYVFGCRVQRKTGG